MKKQYLLKIQFASDVEENKWWIGARLDPMAQPGQRFYKTKAEAKAGLNRLLKKANKEYRYDANGKRLETHSIGGGFSADMVLDKRIDDMNRIVAWSIQRREVTEWEEVERSKE